jgi:O-antigen/teichoic acid export membrane protein
MVTLGLIPAIATLGLPFTMVRFLASEKDKNKIQEGFYTIFWIVSITSSLISLFIIIASNALAVILFDGYLFITLILSVLISITCLNILFLNFFRTFQKMRAYSIFALIQTYFYILLVSFLIIMGYGLTVAVIGYLISQIIVFIIMGIIIVKSIGFKIPSFKNSKEYLSFGLPTIPSMLSYWIVDSSDRYIIGILLGTAFVGYYNPGYSLGSLIMMLIAPLSIILIPVLSKYYDENSIDKVRNLLKYSLKYYLAISIPSVIGISLLSKELLMILTTPEIALKGFMITPFTALSALFYGLLVIFSQIIILKKETKIMGTAWLIAAIFNIILNLIFIPYFGILGAAIATLISYLFSSVFMIIYSLRCFRFEIDLKFILKSIIASVPMFPLTSLLNTNKITDLLLLISLCAFFYLVILMLFKGISKDEINFFRDLFFNF